MLCHRFKYCLRQRMCLKQMPEVQDRRLVGNSVAAKLEMTERTHRLDVVERLLGTWIRKAVPLLQAIDAQHHSDGKRSPTTLRANLWIIRLHERCPRPPRHDRRHLGQKNVALGALLLARKVQRRKAQLRIHDVALRIEDASMPCFAQLVRASLSLQPLSLARQAEKPADLPVQSPTKYEQVNLKTAKAHAASNHVTPGISGITVQRRSQAFFDSICQLQTLPRRYPITSPA